MSTIKISPAQRDALEKLVAAKDAYDAPEGCSGIMGTIRGASVHSHGVVVFYVTAVAMAKRGLVDTETIGGNTWIRVTDSGLAAVAAG